ncbi:hypothetical protein HDK64DRAFT_63829 [Phyllosticta capitalensis]
MLNGLNANTSVVEPPEKGSACMIGFSANCRIGSPSPSIYPLSQVDKEATRRQNPATVRVFRQPSDSRPSHSAGHQQRQCCCKWCCLPAHRKRKTCQFVEPSPWQTRPLFGGRRLRAQLPPATGAARNVVAAKAGEYLLVGARVLFCFGPVDNFSTEQARPDGRSSVAQANRNLEGWLQTIIFKLLNRLTLVSLPYRTADRGIALLNLCNQRRQEKPQCSSSTQPVEIRHPTTRSPMATLPINVQLSCACRATCLIRGIMGSVVPPSPSSIPPLPIVEL